MGSSITYFHQSIGFWIGYVLLVVFLFIRIFLLIVKENSNLTEGANTFSDPPCLRQFVAENGLLIVGICLFLFFSRKM